MFYWVLCKAGWKPISKNALFQQVIWKHFWYLSWFINRKIRVHYCCGLTPGRNQNTKEPFLSHPPTKCVPRCWALHTQCAFISLAPKEAQGVWDLTSTDVRGKQEKEKKIPVLWMRRSCQGLGGSTNSVCVCSHRAKGWNAELRVCTVLCAWIQAASFSFISPSVQAMILISSPQLMIYRSSSALNVFLLKA